MRGASLAMRVAHMAGTIRNMRSIEELASAGTEGARLLDAVQADPELMEMFGNDPGALADLIEADPGQFDAVFGSEAAFAGVEDLGGEMEWGDAGFEGFEDAGIEGFDDGGWDAAGELPVDPDLPEAPPGWEPSGALPDLPAEPALPDAPLGWEPSGELPDLPADPGLPDVPAGWEASAELPDLPAVPGLPDVPAGWEASAELPDLPVEPVGGLPVDPALPEAPAGWEPSAALPDLPADPVVPEPPPLGADPGGLPADPRLPDAPAGWEPAELPADARLPDAPAGWEWEPPPPPEVVEPAAEVSGEIGAEIRGDSIGTGDVSSSEGQGGRDGGLLLGGEDEQHLELGDYGDIHMREGAGVEVSREASAGFEDGGFEVEIAEYGRAGMWHEVEIDLDAAGVHLHGEGDTFTGLEQETRAGLRADSRGVEGGLGHETFVGHRSGVSGTGDLFGMGTVGGGAEYRTGFGFELDGGFSLSLDEVGFHGDLGAALGVGAGTEFDWSLNPTGIYEGVTGAGGDAFDALGSGMGALGGAAGDAGGAVVSRLSSVASWRPW